MSDDEDAGAAASAAILIAILGSQKDPNRRPRRFWVRPSLVRGRKRKAIPVNHRLAVTLDSTVFDPDRPDSGCVRLDSTPLNNV
ncbi:hypothetical protein WA026_005712 [Henosepilachna vigintioctopunctata]|uniref:Uncharacterized protein n=1 Tax=Henosepilachna vigintioctopunctata TaxID=420089 RepID=A0AAW1TX86_9CUCU